jgi:hypothetical protein
MMTSKALRSGEGKPHFRDTLSDASKAVKRLHHVILPSFLPIYKANLIRSEWGCTLPVRFSCIDFAQRNPLLYVPHLLTGINPTIILCLASASLLLSIKFSFTTKRSLFLTCVHVSSDHQFFCSQGRSPELLQKMATSRSSRYRV